MLSRNLRFRGADLEPKTAMDVLGLLRSRYCRTGVRRANAIGDYRFLSEPYPLGWSRTICNGAMAGRCLALTFNDNTDEVESPPTRAPGNCK